MAGAIYKGGPPYNGAWNRFPNNVGLPFQTAGAPVNGTSGSFAGKAGKGSMLVRLDDGAWYYNTGTQASPTWTAFGSTAGAATPSSVASTGAITSSSPSAGIGYATGAGVAVTQATSRTTTVAGNGMSGTITLVSAAGSATPFSFTFTNTSIAANDVVLISQKSGTDKYTTQVVSATAAGSCQITLANASGTTTEQPVFNFVVIKAVAA